MSLSSSISITDPPHKAFQNLTAITGGIGAGKSVVARIVDALGYDVYDCDSRARTLMAEEDITAALAEAFGPDIFTPGGELIRPRLAGIVFNDTEALARLNAITHTAVRHDLSHWALERTGDGRIFVETAILYQSGLDRMVAQVWDVTAPLGLRIERVMSRSGLSRSETLARIDTQDSYVPVCLHQDVTTIVNDGLTPLLPLIHRLLRSQT